MVATLCAVLAIASLAAAVRRGSGRAVPVAVARASTMDASELVRHRQAQQPVWERLLRPAVTAVARRVDGRWTGLTVDDLRRAGIDPDHLGLAELFAVKVLGALTGAVVALLLALLAPAAVLLLPAAAFGGFVAPSIWVTRRRAARRRRMLRELPDLIGLLKAFVTAGISLEQAMHLISEQQSRGLEPNLLATEVRRALSDYGLGLSIESALDLMAQRAGLEELELLASALAQGKRQGAGMERILRDQETVVRLQQRNRAAAEASRVGTRLVGVLVLVYLPEFMLLIMVPLFYGIFLRAFA